MRFFGFITVSEALMLTLALYSSNITTLVAINEYFKALRTFYYRFYYINTCQICLTLKSPN